MISLEKLPAQIRVTERGIRKQGRHTPHNLPFAAMISALRVYMGLPQHTESIQAHNRTWISDLDYYFHVGVSTEGFGLRYDVGRDVLLANRWGGAPVRDCFAAEGIRCRLLAGEDVPSRDGALDRSTLKEQVAEHLAKDRPILLLERLRQSYRIHMALGYAEHGETLYLHSGGKGVTIARDSKPTRDWETSIYAILLVDDLETPADRRTIALRALRRAHEMLTETSKTSGYGDALYETWIERLLNDENYRFKSNALRFLHPEEFDLAERRCYAAEFFRQAEATLEEGMLQAAVQAFIAIHDHMWTIHRLVTGPSLGKGLERQIREDVVDLLRRCQELDHKAAENLEAALRQAGPS
ncbi:MAG TPA: hypothetical protein PKE04_04480 [Clostridia bacterium]|nr:hypothetical protein [Clostridia bacterium]